MHTWPRETGSSFSHILGLFHCGDMNQANGATEKGQSTCKSQGNNWALRVECQAFLAPGINHNVGVCTAIIFMVVEKSLSEVLWLVQMLQVLRYHWQFCQPQCFHPETISFCALVYMTTIYTVVFQGACASPSPPQLNFWQKGPHLILTFLLSQEPNLGFWYKHSCQRITAGQSTLSATWEFRRHQCPR